MHLRITILKRNTILRYKFLSYESSTKKRKVKSKNSFPLKNTLNIWNNYFTIPLNTQLPKTKL